MDGKQPYIVPSITTEEALKLCLREKIGLFAIEGPLFLQGSKLLAYPGFENYEIGSYPDMKLSICKRVSGGNEFNIDRYSVDYYPLAWQGTKDQKTPQPSG